MSDEAKWLPCPEAARHMQRLLDAVEMAGGPVRSRRLYDSLSNPVFDLHPDCCQDCDQYGAICPACWLGNVVYHQGSIAFRWYKHAGRAVESTRPTDDAELELIVDKCIEWMARLDGMDGGAA